MAQILGLVAVLTLIVPVNAFIKCWKHMGTTDWSSCSTTCPGGIRTRTREYKCRAISFTCSGGFGGCSTTGRTKHETDTEKCAPHCANGGTYDANEEHCACPTAYWGSCCDKNIDDCASRPCQNGGRCVDGVNEYTCNCVTGYEGGDCETDIDDCASRPCQNGGRCVDGVNEYTCNCVTGYDGGDCETNIYDCVGRPCQNGGRCNDGVNKYTCNCVAGYIGGDCETNIDDCEGRPCQNGGTCVDGVNEYICNCVDGYIGGDCKTNIDDCAGRPCQNGGRCVDGVNKYTCNCVAGYEGGDCETNIDDCAGRPCQNGGMCVDGVNEYTCICVAGYKGGDCEKDIHECASSPCQNGATCVDGENEYTCNCIAGYEGGDCETNIDDCACSPCQNGGTCVDGVNEYSCNCIVGYEGDDCETNVDDCADSPCQNGGTCVDGVNEYICNCNVGYKGDNCETTSALGVQYKAQVNYVWPNYGPQAGGTSVTIHGHFPIADLFLYVGDKQCKTVYQNSTLGIYITSELYENETHLLGHELPVHVNNSFIHLTPSVFVYKANPEIRKVHPKESISKGGIRLTVNGNGFDSVATIMMTTTMVQKKMSDFQISTTTYTTDCDIQNQTLMFCLTPYIILPDPVLHKPSASGSKGDTIDDETPLKRSRRQKGPIHATGNRDATFEYYIGFTLDGVHDYRNHSKIEIYTEPLFRDTIMLRKFVKGQRLNFKGEHLDRGVTAHDYIITIGGKTCVDIELLSNILSCFPPQIKPENDTNSSLDNTDPMIMMHIGLNVNHFCGHLQYPDTIPMYIVVPGTVLPVVLLIGLIIGIAACYRKRRNTREGKDATIARDDTTLGKNDFELDVNMKPH